MAYVAHPSEFTGRPCRAPANPTRLAEPPCRAGFWRRLLDTVVLSHQREAQRDIEAYMARRGKLTDSVERDIADRFITGGRWGAGR